MSSKPIRTSAIPTSRSDRAAKAAAGTAGAAAPARGDGGRARSVPAYALDSQVGFLLRKAQQRHVSLFMAHIAEDLTPMQFAVLAKLLEAGPCSQNSLGRRTAMDVATIKGVVARLDDRGLVCKLASSEDRRKLLIDLTPDGRRTVARAIPRAMTISALTLEPLTRAEQADFMRLLARLS